MSGKTTHEIVSHYYDLQRRAELRITIQTLIKKLGKAGKSFDQIKEQINKNFPKAEQQVYINDKTIKIFMKE